MPGRPVFLGYAHPPPLLRHPDPLTCVSGFSPGPRSLPRGRPRTVGRQAARVRCALPRAVTSREKKKSALRWPQTMPNKASHVQARRSGPGVGGQSRLLVRERDHQAADSTLAAKRGPGRTGLRVPGRSAQAAGRARARLGQGELQPRGTPVVSTSKQDPARSQALSGGQGVLGPFWEPRPPRPSWFSARCGPRSGNQQKVLTRARLPGSLIGTAVSTVRWPPSPQGLWLRPRRKC